MVKQKIFARTVLSKRMFGHAFLGAALSSVAVGVHAQAPASDTVIEEIIVTAHPLAEGGLAQPSTVLAGDDLDNARAASIGGTLDRQAGVQNVSFGTAVGRPVIHGLGSTRIKITQDQIDTLDVSVTSSDHAVTVEPFMANQISVLKGPSTLLYGSGAIGGVVDVDTGRHKTEMPEEFSGKAEVRFADVDDSVTAAAKLEGRLTDSVAWHFEGFTRDSEDYEIPGFAESVLLRAMEEHDHDEGHDDDHDEEHHDEDHHDDHSEEEETRDILEGSRNKTRGINFGLSQIGERHHLSFSVGSIESDYGLLGGHSHEHGEEDEHGHDDHDEEMHEGHDEHGDEEGVAMIEMEQVRFDLRAGYQFENSFFTKVDFLFAQNDYEHVEIEESGEIGTFFDNEAWEARLELQHNAVLGFEGIVGLQFDDRSFSALGEEAFIEPVDSETQAIFWLGERQVGRGAVETGVRFENVEMNPVAGNMAPSRSFDTFSTSLGYVFDRDENTTFSVIADYSGRAPSIEELYSNGAHLATQSFDIGDVNLEEETALSLSMTGNWQWDVLSINATVYYNNFDDFIYQAGTGEEREELQVFVYEQDDANFYGLDFTAEVQLGKLAGGDLSASALFDFVSADVDTPTGSQNLPRIPSDRLGMGLAWDNADWSVAANYLHVDTQNDLAPFELATQGYEDLSLSVRRLIQLGGNEMQIFVNGRNLTDDEQRHHASFVKDLAPAPGRTIEAGVRLSF